MILLGLLEAMRHVDKIIVAETGVEGGGGTTTYGRLSEDVWSWTQDPRWTWTRTTMRSGVMIFGARKQL